ncbi:hypothetical protein MDAP_000905 [Mitosporidium daphniae]
MLEDLAIIAMYDVFGSRWALMKRFLHGRTDNSIKNHWHSSMVKKMAYYRESLLSILSLIYLRHKSERNSQVLNALLKSNHLRKPIIAAKLPPEWELLPMQLSSHLALIQDALNGRLFGDDQQPSSTHASHVPSSMADLLDAVEAVENYAPKNF